MYSNKYTKPDKSLQQYAYGLIALLRYLKTTGFKLRLKEHDDMPRSSSW